jgi:hypothetical protein
MSLSIILSSDQKEFLIYNKNILITKVSSDISNYELKTLIESLKDSKKCDCKNK